ncbi:MULTISPECIES: MFS transporter [Actinokineospora]|uniref:MFS transporter n=1 Tax=Actinokineospora fastidiosa TaxID=1816 RepID=A0A918LHP2_9PSEU|nr:MULTISPECIES: MFS transporter [Actinokineospora]GGS52535.1 MFS transporter [Actinokineospora fastidiosa]
MTTTPAEAPTGNPLWGRQNRATTVGILLLITIGAFEHLGVSTAMPRMLAELDGGHLYSWPFTAFLAASVISTVLAGRVADRIGPRPVLLVGPALFLVGLVVAGTATAMPTLLAARFLQGLGLGAEAVAIYVLIAMVYPENLRPRMFGLLAAAWVVPSILGPTAAGVVTELVGWRWVFLGLAPLALLGVLLLIPTLRDLPSTESSGPARRGLPLAAVAAGTGIAALTWAVQHKTLWLGLLGLVLLAPALRVLLPAGTLRGRPGLPRVVLGRGLFAGAFFGVEAFVPLTLTAVHGYSPALAGLPLTVGALGWSAASWWQGRVELPRSVLVRIGFTILAVGLAGMALVAPDWPLAWTASLWWAIAGAGMGMAFPAVSVLALDYAAESERGFASSALQVSDMVFSAVMVGTGGVLLAALASTAAPTQAVLVLNLAMAGVAALGALLFARVRD